MRFFGSYERTLWRDAKTGETLFCLAPEGSKELVNDYGNILFRGMIPSYKNGMPLLLEAEEPISPGDPFLVSRCIEWSESEALSVRLLSGFPGVGEETAKRIIASIGVEIFSGARDKSVKKRLIDEGLPGDIVCPLIDWLRGFAAFRDLFSFLSSFGCSFAEAHAWYLAGGGAAAKQAIEKTPYAACGIVPYAVCERIAAKKGVPCQDEKRMNALCLEAAGRGLKAGSTRIPLPAFFSYARMVEEKAGAGYFTSPFFIGAALLEMPDEIVLIKEEEEYCVSLRKMYEKERYIARRVRSLSKEIGSLETACLVADVEKEEGVLFSKEQKEAFSLLSSPGVKVLSGGPGTGKTTVLKGLIRAYEALNPKKTVKLCSPTANAARRMKELTGRSAVTVHSLLGLGVRPGTAVSDPDPLPEGLIIVDEASMLDTELFYELVKRIKNGSILLLVGDEDQLDPVGPGTVFADLADALPCCRLKEAFRQRNETSLQKNGNRIRDGVAPLEEDADTVLFRAGNAEEMTCIAIDEMKKMYEKERPFSVRFLSPVRTRKYPYSTSSFNRVFQEQFNPDGDGLVYDGCIFRVGDPVVFLRNNYAGGYINGDVGIIRSVGHDPELIDVQLDDRTVSVTGTDLENLSLNYAGTVHKAQGSECEAAIVIVPKKPKAMISRKLLYVACTRAKRKNIIISEGDALEYAIANTGYRKRMTALSTLLNTGA